MPATAIVCTRDRISLLERVIGPLGAAVAAVDGAELVIVQQGAGDVESLCRQAGVQARVIRDDGVGASRARNRGWRAARGEVIAFTDDDCEVPRSWLEDHVRALGETGIVVSCGQVSGLSRYGGTTTEVWDQTAVDARHQFGARPWDIGHAANLAARRDALVAVGGFDERLGPGGTRVRAGEDADLLVRLLQVGDARSGVGEAVVHVDWRTPDDHTRVLVDYELGAGAWIGKLGTAHPRAAASMLRARLRMLRTSSPWSDGRHAIAHRTALARGLARGVALGTHRDVRDNMQAR